MLSTHQIKHWWTVIAIRIARSRMPRPVTASRIAVTVHQDTARAKWGRSAVCHHCSSQNQREHVSYRIRINGTPCSTLALAKNAVLRLSAMRAMTPNSMSRSSVATPHELGVPPLRCVAGFRADDLRQAFAGAASRGVRRRTSLPISVSVTGTRATDSVRMQSFSDSGLMSKTRCVTAV